MKTLLLGAILALIGLSGAKAETALLLRTVSISSDSGIANFPAGKTYDVIQATATEYTLKTSDGRTFVAKKEDVTTDPAIIAANATKAPAATPAPAPVQAVKNVAPAPVATPAPDPKAVAKAEKAAKREKIAELKEKIHELEAAIEKGRGGNTPENTKRRAEIRRLDAEIDSLRS